MRRYIWTLVALTFAARPTDAGLFHRKPSRAEVPGGAGPTQLVAPNGVAVPRWASRRMQESPVPLSGYSWGRRPWAYPLNTQATTSAMMARADGFGFGAGPIPGYTNGPGLGNIPSAPMGPGGGTPPGRGYGANFFSPYYISPGGN